MRRAIVGAALVFLATGLAGAQESGQQPGQEPALGFFAGRLSEQERQQIRGITEETAQTIREAQAEIQILKARLNKELVQRQVDMKAVEQLVREAMEWEVKARLARIRRDVEVRKILGDRRWAALMDGARRRGQIDERLQQRLDEVLKLAHDPRLADRFDRSLQGHLRELQRLVQEELRRLHDLRGDL